MHDQILAIIPNATQLSSYDRRVWGHFAVDGQAYEVFDLCNYGADIPKDDPARYTLSRIDGGPEDGDYVVLAVAPTIRGALAPLL